jgi:hypothetical protein
LVEDAGAQSGTHLALLPILTLPNLRRNPILPIRVPIPGSDATPQNRQIDLGLLTTFNSESGETDERINLPKRPAV